MSGEFLPTRVVLESVRGAIPGLRRMREGCGVPPAASRIQNALNELMTAVALMDERVREEVEMPWNAGGANAQP